MRNYRTTEWMRLERTSGDLVQIKYHLAVPLLSKATGGSTTATLYALSSHMQIQEKNKSPSPEVYMQINPDVGVRSQEDPRMINI